MPTFSFTLQEAGTADAVQKFINANIDEFCSAITFSEKDRNERVEIGDVSAKDVRILKDGAVEIDIEYEWSYFSPCKDIGGEGLVTETFEARIVGGIFEIASMEAPEPRNTVDEF